MTDATDAQPVAACEELSLRLTPAEINALVGYLGRAPYLEVAELIHKIAGQVQSQLIEQQRAAVLAAVPAGSEARN